MQAQTDRATLHAANDNPGGDQSAQVALRGLVTLLARAEIRRASEAAANTNTDKTKKGGRA
jgi:hypothetical protein